MMGGPKAARMDKAVVLLSGGMDSATLIHYVRKRLKVRHVWALSFVYGQKHARELEMARRQARSAGATEHREVDLSGFAELTGKGSALTDPAVRIPDLAELGAKERRQPPTYVPNRNMVFLALAAAFAEAQGAQDVFYGAQAQDEYGYWDCSPAFVERVNAVLGLNRKKRVRVHAPFAGMRKAAVVRIGRKLGVNYADTWTCYRGGRKPCGTCPSCVERDRAFREAGEGGPREEIRGEDHPPYQSEAHGTGLRAKYAKYAKAGKPKRRVSQKVTKGTKREKERQQRGRK